MTTLVIIVGGVLAPLAIIAWACAWQTLHWLAAAEDLLEGASDIVDSYVEDTLEKWGKVHEDDLAIQAALLAYERRTPRRS